MALSMGILHSLAAAGQPDAYSGTGGGARFWIRRFRPARAEAHGGGRQHS
jgi:hypothetical protein